jgi:uncharacterized protein
MRKIDNKIIYSPSDLITYMESEFDSWADRYALEFPDEVEKDAIDPSLQLVSEHGNKHEDLFLQHLKSLHSVAEILGDKDFAAQATLKALQSGSDVIYQGYLAKDSFAGRSDFLVKVDGKSRFGPYHYEVWDTKLARKAKPYFVIQLCCYAEMLESLQGVRPEFIRIVLGDNAIKSFLIKEYFGFYQHLKQRFLAFQDCWRKDKHPRDSQPGPHTTWKAFAQKMFDGTDDLSSVANIRKSQIKKLKAAGITTKNQLASSQFATVPKLKAETLATLQRQARLQLQTAATGHTAYEVLPNRQGKGLELLPPASVNDVFFDMEGYPHTEGGLEYLFGAIIQAGSEAGSEASSEEWSQARSEIRSKTGSEAEFEAHSETAIGPKSSQPEETEPNGSPTKTFEKRGQTRFIDWWAHNRVEEKQAFEAFIDWIYERWIKDPAMHVFHYAAYEVSALRRLAGRHATRIEKLDQLLRHRVFVDLYQIVRHSLQIGESSYSIKCVERLYSKKRTGGVAKATDSVIYYEHWIEQQDGRDWQTSLTLKSIRDYNRDDCLSTYDLAKFLRNIQGAHAIEYRRIDKETYTTPDNSATLLAEELLKSAEEICDSEEKRVQKLLAGLIEFHRREDKPKWWRALDKQEATDEDLYEDLDCLQGLTRTSTLPVRSKQSLLYEYQFDPDQPTRLEPGQSCRFVHDVFSTITPYSLDTATGRIWLPVGKEKPPPPAALSLTLNEMVPTNYLAESIFRIAQSWKQDHQLPKALADFLFRHKPRVRGVMAGQPITRSADLQEISLAVTNMQETCLCIQGPPGSGKTTAAGYTIVELLRSGKRVGITSNSHKAIANLLREIMGRAATAGLMVRAAQVCSKGNAYEPIEGVALIETSTRLFSEISDLEKDRFNLVAGTAWVFSNPLAAQMFDYLFVDEAGQVCLANVVSMSQSAQNLVLLGDQQQLEQPVQGSHPEEVERSALEYILQDQATIPLNFGVFLDVSRRMHPQLCQFISAAIYDSRLTADLANARQVIIPPQALTGRFPKNAGLVWVPCSHDGNTQSSSEEAQLIEALVNDLLRCQFAEKSGAQRPIRLSDIIIVAPYNLQAKLISKRLPGARVASVDKFQGSEAPIVILSMCASDGRSSPRGLEFLFSRSRLNVAISRAKSLAFVVGSPSLVDTPCSTLEQMRLVNFFCQIVECGTQSINPEKSKLFSVSQISQIEAQVEV